jgi:hypothetical protein
MEGAANEGRDTNLHRRVERETFLERSLGCWVLKYWFGRRFRSRIVAIHRSLGVGVSL